MKKMKKIVGNDFPRRAGVTLEEIYPYRNPPYRAAFKEEKKEQPVEIWWLEEIQRLEERQKRYSEQVLKYNDFDDDSFQQDNYIFEEKPAIIADSETQKSHDFHQIEEQQLKSSPFQLPVKTMGAKKKCKEIGNRKEVRMQEIEDDLMQLARFCKINGFLCRWTGSCYRQLDLELFTLEARNLLSKEAERKISRFNRYKEAYNFMLANEKLEKMFSDKAVMDAKSMIAFRNGLYNGKTGEWKKLSFEYPILFNIDAKYLGENEPETPHMDQIILSATGGNEEVLELFYQVLGYIFSQGVDAKKFFVFATAPDSGKSIIGEFLGRILGEDNISVISMDDLGQRFSLGKIGTKALNYNMDLPAAELDKKSVQKIKQLTGDPRIDCEEKYVQNRTVVHHCKLLYASNHPILLKEEDEAFYRRLVLIPFLYSVSDEDKDYQLLDKLWMERDAIATKAAHAYRRLYNNNFIFQKSDLAEEMLSAWKGERNQTLLSNFAQEKCIFYPEDVGIFTPTEELFQMYQKYCFEKGRNIDDSEKSMFSRQFAKSFDVKKGKKRVAGYESPVNGYYGVEISDSIQ